MMTLFMVELLVADLNASLCWYRDVLGLPVEILDEANQFALLGRAAGRIALKQGVAEPGGVIIHFEIPNLQAEVERLAKCGALPSGSLKQSTEGYRRARFHDPDGYAIVLFEWVRSDR